MYKIGEFSNMTGVSVKTLRYYDQINLLKPSKIDKYSNYRYYTDSEIFIFKKIEYLKKLGFSLEEIKNNIDCLSSETIDLKINELIIKRDYIDNQIIELDMLKKKINKKEKVLKLN